MREVLELELEGRRLGQAREAIVVAVWDAAAGVQVDARVRNAAGRLKRAQEAVTEISRTLEVERSVSSNGRVVADRGQVVRGEETAKNTDSGLKRVKRRVTVKVEVVAAPLCCAVVLVLEVHHQERVERVDDSVADRTNVRQVRAAAREGVELILAKSTLL